MTSLKLLSWSFLYNSKDIQSANLNGEGRWETAVNISKSGWSKSSEAILVNEQSTTDVLTTTPFAKSKDAPVLLTNKDKLDTRTSEELTRLGVTKVYLNLLSKEYSVDEFINDKNIR